jgi:hypothetical protein
MRLMSFLCSFMVICAVFAGSARADVLVLSESGKVTRADDPGVASHGDRSTRGPVARASAKKKRRTVISELKRMRDAGAIDAGTYSDLREEYESAKAFVKRIPAGRRRIEMAAAVGLLDRMAERGSMIVSRLEPLWQTLRANREWWASGPLLGSGQRVRVGDSEIVWQYVPNQGLQIHPLANFGKLNALWRAKRKDDQLEQLMDELLPLAASRAGGLAWEYYFDYGGGRAPWVSGLSQGTALQSIARAAIRLQRKEEVFPLLQQGLTVFQTPPPAGVRLDTGDGAHYLIYSFNSELRVLNAFVQSLVGLYDFAAYANDDVTRALFADGDRVLQREVPKYDTGFWSKYSQARESDLGYHKLVTGFLENLCERTGTPIYCETGARFNQYLVEAPILEVVSEKLRGGKAAPLRFRVSKISRVTVRVERGEKVVAAWTALTGGGARSFTWSVPKRKGEYEVRVSATDLAGNSSSLEDVVEVLKPRK